jgi:hypothetical protein
MTKWRGYECRVDCCERSASPLCYEHGYEIAMLYEAAIVTNRRLRLNKQAEQVTEIHEVKRGNREPSVVYYARIGDYIKIGFTTRLRNRLATLRVDELLAVEPGGEDLEHERHRQFAVERIDLRRENFRPSDRLTSHVVATREEYGLPYWAKLPRTSQITTRTRETP